MSISEEVFVSLFGLYFISSVAAAALCTEIMDFFKALGCDGKDKVSHCLYFLVIIYFYF